MSRRCGGWLTLLLFGLAAIFARPALAGEAARPGDAEPQVTRSFLLKQFAQFDLDYPGRRFERLARLEQPERRLFALQQRGLAMACSAQILNETRWLLNSTAEFTRADKNLWFLDLSLTHPEQGFALEQDDYVGQWGLCYDEHFKKIDPMITALNELASRNEPPSFGALALLTRPGMTTARDMTRFLDRLRISDIPRDGLNHRDELGAYAAVLAELLYKQPLRDYISRHIAGGKNFATFADAFTAYLDDWQDPETGFWGPWYRAGDRVLKARDLSFTYHIVAYRQGKVRRWDRLVETLLAIRREEYPFGWLQRGRLTSHHAYDVARIIKLGWPGMSAKTRREAAQALDEVLNFVLWEGLNPDGSVTPRAGFSSGVDDEYYYAVSLLTTAGYCSSGRAFWTDREFPEAGQRCCDIAANLEKLLPGTARLRSAHARLRKSSPICRDISPAALSAAASDAGTDRNWSDPSRSQD